MDRPIPVLLVAHQSPPLGGPGVRRVASWMRHWPAAGIDPVLLTAPAEDGAAAHGYPVIAGSDSVLGGRTVVRVPTPPVGGFAGVLRAVHAPPRLVWTLCYGSMREPETPWSRPAIDRGVEEGMRLGVRAVVSSSQPYANHAAGCKIAKALGVPWIADFRDPMSEAEGRSWPTQFYWWGERRLERRWFERAARIWATTDAAANRWRERFPWAAEKIVVHRNGVGPGIVSLAGAGGAPPPPFPPLRIGHAGRFTDHGSAESRLGWLDFRLGRDSATGSSPLPLFAGMKRFLNATPAAGGALTWVTIGDPGPDPPEGVTREHHGAVANDEALRVASGCHALYLPLTRPPPTGALNLPQKTYEYAALGRPVLVSGSPREATEFLGDLALISPFDDVDAMATNLQALWDSRGGGASKPRPAPLQATVARECADEILALCRA